MSPGYPAQKAELQSGDVVRAVNGKPVKDLEELTRLYAESIEKKDPTVLLQVKRGRAARSAVMRVEYE
jgi:S1-C subfamily serine protease